jgi:hypothetical protein
MPIPPPLPEQLQRPCRCQPAQQRGPITDRSEFEALHHTLDPGAGSGEPPRSNALASVNVRAKGATEARLTREAKAALERLTRRVK